MSEALLLYGFNVDAGSPDFAKASAVDAYTLQCNGNSPGVTLVRVGYYGPDADYYWVGINSSVFATSHDFSCRISELKVRDCWDRALETFCERVGFSPRKFGWVLVLTRL